MAEGGAKRIRAVEGQKTLLARTMHAIEYDEVHDEIVVPQQFGQGILTFAGNADGEAPPLRYIQGPSTRLFRPSRLAVDPVNDEIYVPEDEELLVYPRTAQGDVAPKRILVPDGWDVGAIAVDPVRNLLVMATARHADGPTAILFFDRTASGLVKPKRVISGPKTGLLSTRNLRINSEKGWVAVVEVGSRESAFDSSGAFVGIWNLTDDGDVPPRIRIGGPNGPLKQPRGVALDPAHKNILVSDKVLNAVLTYHYPELF